MARIRKVTKGTTPPGVGIGRRKENDKSIKKKQKDMSLKGIAAAHGYFILSTQHHSETTFSFTGDTAAN